MDEYAKVVPEKQLFPHPRSVTSQVAAHQWALDNLDDEVVWRFDDDLLSLRSFVSRTHRTYTDPDEIDQVLENTVEMARGAGAHLAGFTLSLDPKAFMAWNPIRLCHSINGSCFAVIGRTVRLDTKVLYNDDVDFALQHLMKHRIILVDTRFNFASEPRNGNKGWAASYRSVEQYLAGAEYMKQKWGRYVKYTTRPGKAVNAQVTQIVVRRQQTGTIIGGV